MLPGRVTLGAAARKNEALLEVQVRSRCTSPSLKGVRFRSKAVKFALPEARTAM
jgi:hypothetical protein